MTNWIANERDCEGCGIVGTRDEDGIDYRIHADGDRIRFPRLCPSCTRRLVVTPAQAARAKKRMATAPRFARKTYG